MSSGDLKATDFGRVTDTVAGDKRSTYTVSGHKHFMKSEFPLNFIHIFNVQED